MDIDVCHNKHMGRYRYRYVYYVHACANKPIESTYRPYVLS